MPYCAVYGCNSDSKRDKSIHWFSFPNDPNRLKVWLHYCRRKDFVLSKHSKICGKHFSSSQLSRDPAKLAEFGYVGARPALKDDAMPDIAFSIEPRTKLSEDVAKKTPRQAFQKRRKLEVCICFSVFIYILILFLSI